MSQPSDQNHSTSKSLAPDPAHNYERAKPERESPSGSLHQHAGTPHAQPDKVSPQRLGATPTDRPSSGDHSASTSVRPSTNPDQVDHSMKEEEPDGWDLAPGSIADPHSKRHPRTEGKGGVR